MAGPWEKYQEAEAGPWTKYATAESVAAPAEPKSGLSQAFDVLTAGPRAAGNLVAGAVRGAGSIGATLLAPMDMINSKMEGRPLMEANNQRRADMTAGLQSMGADPSSLAFGAGKLGGEIAGTAGVGGAIARVPGIPAALADAIGTAGMRAGGASGLAGVGTRAAGGAITGGASAGLVNPQDAGTGVLIGGALPPVMAGAGKLGQMAGSALKGEFAGLRRIRVGDYRIIYEVDDGVLLVLVIRIAPRREVYR